MRRLVKLLSIRASIILHILLLTAIAFGPISAIRTEINSPHLSPELLQLAIEHPNQKIPIIIQRESKGYLSADMLQQMGGEEIQEFPMINGIALELPGRAVETLAYSENVRWISQDAPLRPTQSIPPFGESCNVLKNGGFEAGLQDWEDWSGTLQLQTSQNVYAGTASVQLGASAGGISQPIFTAAVGETYTAQGLFMHPSGSTWANLGIDFFDANWNEIGETIASIPETSSYKPVSISGVAPAGTVYMSFWVWKSSGNSLLMDNLSLTSASTMSGSCQGYTSSVGYNLLTNPSFESDLSSWYLGGASSLQISSNAYAGVKAAQLGSVAESISQNVETAVAGTTYTAQGMFIRSPGSAWTGMGIDFFDANWNEISDVMVEIPESSSYIPVSISGVAPTGTVHLSVWIWKDNGGSLLIDNVSVVSGEIQSAYTRSIGAEQLWHESIPRDGEGVTIAVIDSGISNHADLQNGSGGSRIIANVDFTNSSTTDDNYGHGTHVAGIIGGNGNISNGGRSGIAPSAKLINLKVSDNQGASQTSDLLEGLEWVYTNKDTYNIRVVNISLNSTVAESYHVSPLNAAVEILWFNGITVVVAAGNNGSSTGPVTLYPPANDPFVITVGATDDRGTFDIQDDVVENFSAFGTTAEGFAKPDLVAPGRNLISSLASTNSTVYSNYALHRVDTNYFRMSGTSMAAPVVTGAVALLLQDEPNLTPDQIKYRLKATAFKNWPGYDAAKANAGYLNIYAAVHGTTSASANTGIAASQLLWTGNDPVAWSSVNWNSVNWNSVNWNSVNWNSVNWNSVNWNSEIWDHEIVTGSLVEENSAPIVVPDIDPTLGFTSAQNVNRIENQLYLPLIVR